jgi:hypothetical protein
MSRNRRFPKSHVAPLSPIALETLLSIAREQGANPPRAPSVTTIASSGPRIPSGGLRELFRSGFIATDLRSGGLQLTARGHAALSELRATGPRMAEAPDRPEASGTRGSVGLLRALRNRRDKDGLALLTAVQVEAGERLASDFLRGQLMPRVTADWSSVEGAPRRRGVPGFGVELRESTAAAQDRFRAALAVVSPEFTGLLISVCCLDARIEDIERTEGWPQRSAKILLQIALNQLARHYGMIVAAPARGRIRQAGSADYRPNLDAWVAPSG